jgi:hypothetical protein
MSASRDEKVDNYFMYRKAMPNLGVIFYFIDALTKHLGKSRHLLVANYLRCSGDHIQGPLH